MNFRFHLVSLTAVFFALALGVTVGATVLERTTVDTLESQVSRVERRLDDTDRLNAQLRSELELRDSFAEQMGDRLLQGRLEGVPIVLIGVAGTERTPVDALRGALTAAGADVEAVVEFRQKVALEEEGDARQLADLLETTATRPVTLRRQLFSALSTSWSTGTADDLLEALGEGGFVSYEATTADAGAEPDGPGATPDDPAPDDTLPDDAGDPVERRFVVVASTTAEVAAADVVVPFIEELVSGGERLVLAAEPGEQDDGAFAAPFVGTLRARDSVAGLISTVDNVGTFIGRTAAVLALADLGTGRLGHYGRGEGAESLVPPTSSE